MESFNEVSLNKEISLNTPTMTEHMLQSGTVGEPEDLTGLDPFNLYTTGEVSEDISTPTEKNAGNTEENTNNIFEQAIAAARNLRQQMSQLLGLPAEQTLSVSEDIAAEDIDHTNDTDPASEPEGEEYNSDESSY